MKSKRREDQERVFKSHEATPSQQRNVSFRTPADAQRPIGGGDEFVFSSQEMNNLTTPISAALCKRQSHKPAGRRWIWLPRRTRTWTQTRMMTIWRSLFDWNAIVFVFVWFITLIYSRYNFRGIKMKKKNETWEDEWMDEQTLRRIKLEKIWKILVWEGGNNYHFCKRISDDFDVLMHFNNRKNEEWWWITRRSMK